jgi:sulfopyruvate decarboxylase alpha subunit
MTARRSKEQISTNVDQKLVAILLQHRIEPILSLPCNMLSGILQEIGHHPLQHIQVCREEEGVGIAAGAALAGKRPLLLMQNSGLGNSINALMSLTSFYKLPLFILMSHRGGRGEKIAAQMPMGYAAPRLLETLGIPYLTISSSQDIPKLGLFIGETFRKNEIHAAFLARELWNETK